MVGFQFPAAQGDELWWPRIWAPNAGRSSALEHLASRPASKTSSIVAGMARSDTPRRSMNDIPPVFVLLPASLTVGLVWGGIRGIGAGHPQLVDFIALIGGLAIGFTSIGIAILLWRKSRRDPEA